MVMKKEEQLEPFAYALGVVSIIFGILQPLWGVGFGIAGIVLSRKNNSELGKKARKFSTIGIIIGILVILISFALGFYLASHQSLLNPLNSAATTLK